MTEKGLPQFPNYRGTFGTSLPVVGALMASISAAFLAIPMLSEEQQKCLSFLPWTPNQLSMVSGTLALACFVYSSFSGVYAHALAIDQVDLITRDEMLEGFDSNKEIQEWRDSCEDYYGKARRAWVNGVMLLSITIGILASGKVHIELPIMALMAIIVGVRNVKEGAIGVASFAILAMWSVVLIITFFY